MARLGRARTDELAAQLDMPLSTVYRYVRQLRDMEYLYEVDGLYCLGVRFTSGEHRRETGHLVRLAEPVLRALRDDTGEAVVLSVRVQTAALCLDRFMPRRRYLMSFQPGSVRPLYAGASATPLLAFAPREVLNQVLAGPLRRFTAKSQDRASLQHGLARVRERGFAISHGEVDPHLMAVGAPVFRGRTCICALSVVSSAGALMSDAQEATVKSVLEASVGLSRALDTIEGAAAWTQGEEL